MKSQIHCFPILAVGMAVIFSTAILAGPLYTVTDLGPLFIPTAINDSGQIVGAGFVSGGPYPAGGYFPAIYDGGQVTVIESTPGFQGQAYGINNSGQVVGYANQGNAFEYSGGTLTYFNSTLGAAFVYGINASGEVVGAAFPSVNAGTQAFSYIGGKVTFLGTLGGSRSGALGVNDAGQIVGWSTLLNDATDNAFLYNGGALINLGTLPAMESSHANAVNCAGQVVGISFVGSSGTDGIAFTYANGVMTSLGTLPGNAFSDALGINCAGQIVGWSGGGNGVIGGAGHRAFIYENGVMYDLNSLVSLSTVLTGASGINDSGQIVAYGANGDGYLLTPINQAGCSEAISSGGNTFTATGGSATVAVTTGANCSWTVSGVPSWVTITNGASGTGPGSVSYTVAPNSSANALSSILTIDGLPYEIQEQGTSGPSLIGSMPHLAAEGGWNTTFTLVNKGLTSTQTQVSMFDNSGNPLAVPLTFPQQASNSLTEASASQPLPANASLIVEVSGPANVPSIEGSAQLDSAGTVDGFAIFHYNPTNQEAVVPMETRTASSYLLAFDNTNGVLTGVAIENVSAQSATIPVIIRDDAGTRIFSGMLPTLNADGHMSFVLSTQFPSTANIRGTMEFDAPDFPTPGHVSVLGIRYTGGTLTTIPILANVGTSGGLMAHLASGNGWQTTFALVNTGTTAASATLNFFADTGAPQALPLTILETGNASTASSITQTIAAGASLWVQSTGAASAALQTGSAQLTTTGNVSGYAIFRYNPNGQEAGVPLESRNANSYILAFDNTDSTATGIAISIVSSQTANVPVVIRDDVGNQLQTGPIPLNANGHFSQVLATLFPITAGIRGTLEFDTPAGAAISVLGIRSPPTLTFTTLPPLAK